MSRRSPRRAFSPRSKPEPRSKPKSSPGKARVLTLPMSAYFKVKATLTQGAHDWAVHATLVPTAATAQLAVSTVSNVAIKCMSTAKLSGTREFVFIDLLYNNLASLSRHFPSLEPHMGTITRGAVAHMVCVLVRMLARDGLVLEDAMVMLSASGGGPAKMGMLALVDYYERRFGMAVVDVKDSKDYEQRFGMTAINLDRSVKALAALRKARAVLAAKMLARKPYAAAKKRVAKAEAAAIDAQVPMSAPLSVVMGACASR